MNLSNALHISNSDQIAHEVLFILYFFCLASNNKLQESIPTLFCKDTCVFDSMDYLNLVELKCTTIHSKKDWDTKSKDGASEEKSFKVSY